MSTYIREEDAEKASYAYLMSTIVLIIGLPMPVINLLAILIFYLGNRKRSYFVRFHCLQSLLSQLVVIALNSIAIWWTLSIVFGSKSVTDSFIAYIIVALCCNLIEFIISMYAAVRVRKKHDVRFWIFGPLTELMCKPDKKTDTE
jgi:uncharacterized membrane protein